LNKNQLEQKSAGIKLNLNKKTTLFQWPGWKFDVFLEGKELPHGKSCNLWLAEEIWRRDLISRNAAPRAPIGRDLLTRVKMSVQTVVGGKNAARCQGKNCFMTFMPSEIATVEKLTAN